MSVSKEAPSPMTRERLTAIVHAYGGNVARWPVNEREAAVSFLGEHPEVRGALEDAAVLDAALDNMAPVGVAASLSARLMAQFDAIAARPSVRRFIARLSEAVWPGAPLWQPSAAL